MLTLLDQKCNLFRKEKQRESQEDVLLGNRRKRSSQNARNTMLGSKPVDFCI
jgi:hypothetical protein